MAVDVVRDRQVVRRKTFRDEVAQELKSLVRFPGTGSGLNFRYTRRAAYSAQQYVGDGLGSGIVGACINWMARNYPQAKPGVWDHTDDSNPDGERVMDHDLVRLIQRPNGAYSGRLLVMASVISWIVNGNIYWLKGRNAAGRVVELWYIPHFLMTPRVPYDGSEYLLGYDYRPQGQTLLLPVEDVVHIRHGLDPSNVRRGRSPIVDVLTSIFTDDEAERFTTTLLRNYAIPGLILAPATDDVRIEQDDADVIKLRMMQQFGDDRRGEPVVLSTPARIEQFGFNPQQMDMSALRDVAEERVTSVIGLPAAVVGFGAGLQRLGENATIRELRQEAWEGNGIPTLDTWADEVNLQLMPDFGEPFDSPRNFGWDYSRVRALQDDEDKKETRWGDALVKGGITRAEFRRKFDLEVTPADEVYYVPVGVLPTAPDEVVKAADPNAPQPALPPGPQPAALAAGDQAAAVQKALDGLREAVTKMARPDGIDPLVVMAELERARDQRHGEFMGGLLKVAQAIIERKEVPAPLFATVREVLERDKATGLAVKVLDRPVPLTQTGEQP